MSVRHPNRDTDSIYPVGYINLEFNQERGLGRDRNFAAIGMHIVYKAMRLDAITMEEYVEIVED